MLSRSRSVGTVSFALFTLVASGCKDAGKESARNAGDDTKVLAALVDSDVAEVEAGLPLGAAKLAPLFAPGMEDDRKNLNHLRQRLLAVRREVPDLTKAKSTFFALTDETGVALRNDLQEDVMAGQSLVAVFPELAKALTGVYVETTGGFAATKTKKDLDWVAATPIKSVESDAGPAGKIVGLYITGWTFRNFARHLQESRKHDFAEAAKGKGGELRVPIEYVAVFADDVAYPAPLTPPVDEDALNALHLTQATANGPASGSMSLTDREFGWSAVRTPKLGANTGIVVLRSEI